MPLQEIDHMPLQESVYLVCIQIEYVPLHSGVYTPQRLSRLYPDRVGAVQIEYMPLQESVYTPQCLQSVYFVCIQIDYMPSLLFPSTSFACAACTTGRGR